MTNFLQDFRYGLRSLAKKPGFAVTAVLTLALGIGANVAVFSIVNALILRPYTFPELDRLVVLRAAGPKVLSELRIAPADFIDLQRDSSIFRGVAAFRQVDVNLTGSSDSEAATATAVSQNFFDLLGVQPSLGRQFAAEETQAGRDAVVILNFGFWQRRFSGDRNTVGRSMELDGRKMTIVGIMPRDFRYPVGTDMWVPLVLTPQMMAERDAQAGQGQAFQVLARLRPDVSLSRAQSEVQAFAVRLQRQFPDTHTDRNLSLLLLRKEQFEYSAPLFLTLQVAALFVLLLAMANLFNLLLARLIDRQKDVAVRTAVGASQLRLLQLFMGETLSLALLGGGIALMGSYVAVNFIRDSMPQDYTKWVVGWDSMHLDQRVIGFAVILTVIVGLLFALGASWRSGASDLNRVLKEGARAGGQRRGRLRKTLVTAQIAFAAVLLAGAALMVQGFFRLAHIYKTFDPGNVLTMEITLPDQRYDDDAKVRSFQQQLLERVAALPGVQSAGTITNPPASNVDSVRSLFAIEGQTILRESEAPSADLQSVSPDFFRALRIPVLRGRDVTDHDGFGAPLVAVISRTMAARFWPGVSPIGVRIKIGAPGSQENWTTIVGVVEDVKQNWWDNVPRPVIYRPFAQVPKRWINFAIRTSFDPSNAAAAVRDVGRALDPSVSFSLSTMDSDVSQSLAPIRILGILMAVFGVVSIALSALGIYGLLAHSVAQRTHEFGIRMALGAQRRDVLRLVLRQSWKLCAVGLLIGLPSAYLIVRLIESMLYGVIAFDVIVFVALALMLTGVALLAGYLPAKRATKVDPMLALRYE